MPLPDLVWPDATRSLAAFTARKLGSRRGRNCSPGPFSWRPPPPPLSGLGFDGTGSPEPTGQKANHQIPTGWVGRGCPEAVPWEEDYPEWGVSPQIDTARVSVSGVIQGSILYAKNSQLSSWQAIGMPWQLSLNVTWAGWSLYLD